MQDAKDGYKLCQCCHKEMVRIRKRNFLLIVHGPAVLHQKLVKGLLEGEVRSQVGWSQGLAGQGV